MGTCGCSHLHLLRILVSLTVIDKSNLCKIWKYVSNSLSDKQQYNHYWGECGNVLSAMFPSCYVQISLANPNHSCGIVRLLSSYFEGLVQKRRNSIANALELRIYCNNPSTWYSTQRDTWIYYCLKVNVSILLTLALHSSILRLKVCINMFLQLRILLSHILYHVP